ncbi:DNA-3-methyladenine glycosylase [Pedobacter frigiditerrae]|uniref:Putative 3-methyladenine DNA glycosylase n=1 Tax=Pedobacter frigiditerrae TaxID=2530452 RepID=A0A4R0MX06_9SPHI|nr:DNA-3-methyladenine glycosylase [Pedobacter frigiditerrae]TCC90484.1 DNA-3-methyladenine glycosylase [Pedobacter frigiditerrae]
MPKLPYSFYQQDDVTNLAVQLLGRQLFTLVDGKLTGGTIVETEAYNGIIDKASHAYNGRFTPRTATMYEAGGISYVYLCYGIHHLFNVVTNSKNNPHAVLIRGIEPTEGLSTMLARRNMQSMAPRITAGPGALAKALGIDKNLNAKDLLGDEIWIEDNGIHFKPDQIIASPRVGVDYAEDHALLPWRFYIKGNKFVSKPNS